MVGSLLFLGACWVSFRLRREHPAFTQKGWNLVILGLFIIGLHVLLDGIDTIVYHAGEEFRGVYDVLDVFEELVGALGWVVFGTGLIMFARHLLELWYNPELETIE